MVEPVVRVDGDKVTVGRFTFVDPDIAEYLEAESKDNRTKVVRDAIIIGMKVMLDQRVSLSTEAVLDKVEQRVNEILTNPDFQKTGSPFANLRSALDELTKEIRENKSKKKLASYDKGDTYEEYIESLLKEEFGYSAKIYRTGSTPTRKGNKAKPGDIHLSLNSGVAYETNFAIEAKDRARDGLSIRQLRTETERIISERKVSVVVWAISNDLASKLIQSGTIDWNIDYGYVIVNADPDQPEKARPLLGAAVRVAQLVNQWQLKVDRQFDLQAAHEFLGKLRLRLQKIKDITASLNVIGSAQKEANAASEALYQALNSDIETFTAELGPSAVAGQE